MADLNWKTNALKKEYPKMSDRTLKNYVKNYGRFFENGEDIQEAHEKFLLDKPVSTRLNYLWSVFRAHKVFGSGDLPDWMYEMEKTGKKELKEHYQSQNKSKKESDNWITLAELQKYNKAQRTALSAMTQRFTTPPDKVKLKEWLITSLYVLDPQNHPPMRVDYNMEVTNDENGGTEPNYLYIKNKTHKFFVFRDYKTVGAYGEKKIPLSRKMNAVMNIYLKFHKGKYLFGDDENITKNGLQKAITKAFKGTGKHLGVSMLRHIIISENVDTGDKLKEKAEMADKMGHSTASQEIYKKFDDAEDK